MTDSGISRRKGAGLFGGWLVVYLVIPFVGLAIYVAYHGVGSAPGVLSASYISAATATMTTLILVVFGVPFASYLAHNDSVSSRVARALIRLPLGIPPLVSGIMLLIAFGPYSAIGGIFKGRLVSSMAAIVLAQLFVEMPFVIEGTRSAFSALSPEVFEVSSLLGIPNWRRIIGVELPLSIKTVRTAVMMGWLRAFGEFGATVLVAYHPTSLPVLIFTQFSGTGLSSAILPVAAVLIVSSVAVALISRITTPSKMILGISTPSGVVRAKERSAQSVAAKGRNDRIEFEVSGQLGSFALGVEVEARGSSLSITGPSGSGKSMTLRAITGLLPSFLKRLHLGDLEQPKIAYVPQGQGLFEHLDVYSQLALAARWTGGLRKASEIEGRILVTAGQVGIVPLLRRSISTLSGGQRQRVALARAIASDPDLLILDEPFSALDRFERDRQIRFVRSLTRELNLYLIVVTHDISEAAYLSDFLAIIDKGTVIARGSVGELLKNPGTVKVAQILGYENILSIVPRYPGRFDLADDAVEAGASKTSIVFKSSGNKVDSWVASSVSELSLRFDVIDDLVRLYGVCVIEDCIDLGNQKSVVLSIKKGPKIELDLGSTFSDDAVGVGTIVEVSVRLDPRSTSIL